MGMSMFMRLAQIAVASTEQLLTCPAQQASRAAPSWGLDRIDQRERLSTSPTNTYNSKATGAGVIVYVVDTGVATASPQFTGRVLPGRSFITGVTSAEDDEGHGSHVAGTVLGSTFGVATVRRASAVHVFVVKLTLCMKYGYPCEQGAQLVPVKVLDAKGSGTISGIIDALNWITIEDIPAKIAAGGVKGFVINMYLPFKLTNVQWSQHPPIVLSRCWLYVLQVFGQPQTGFIESCNRKCCNEGCRGCRRRKQQSRCLSIFSFKCCRQSRCS